MATKKKAKALKGQFKSAVTGQFVSSEKAGKNPKTTYKVGKKKTTKKNKLQ